MNQGRHANGATGCWVAPTFASFLLASRPTILGTPEAEFLFSYVADWMPDRYVEVTLRIVQWTLHMKIQDCPFHLTWAATRLGSTPQRDRHLSVNVVPRDLVGKKEFPRTFHCLASAVPRLTDGAKVAMVACGT